MEDRFHIPEDDLKMKINSMNRHEQREPDWD